MTVSMTRIQILFAAAVAGASIAAVHATGSPAPAPQILSLTEDGRPILLHRSVIVGHALTEKSR